MKNKLFFFLTFESCSLLFFIWCFKNVIIFKALVDGLRYQTESDFIDFVGPGLTQQIPQIRDDVSLRVITVFFYCWFHNIFFNHDTAFRTLFLRHFKMDKFNSSILFFELDRTNTSLLSSSYGVKKKSFYLQYCFFLFNSNFVWFLFNFKVYFSVIILTINIFHPHCLIRIKRQGDKFICTVYRACFHF